MTRTHVTAASEAASPGDRSPRAGRRLGPGGRGVLWGVVAVAYAWVMVQASLSGGRMSFGVIPDDALYLGPAAERVWMLYEHGPLHVLLGDAADPPKAIPSVYLATASFLVLGLHDWSPYIGNAMILVAALAVTDRLLSTAGLGVKLAAATLVLTTPLAARTVVDFLPDPAWGLAVAAAAVGTMLRPPVDRSRTGWIVLGAAWAIPLWIKPNVFPVTLILYAVAMLGAAMFRPRADWGRAARGSAGCAATTLLLTLPLALVAGPTVLGYIHANIFGTRRDIWLHRGDAWSHLTYYLTGHGGRRMLGHHLLLLGPLWLVGVGWLLWRGDAADRRVQGGLLLFALAAYALPTLNAVKNPFWGSAVQWLLVLWVILLGARGLEVWSRGGQRWRRPGVSVAACWLVAGAGLLLMHLPRDAPPEPVRRRGLAVRAAIYEVLRDRMADRTPGDPLRVAMLTAGGTYHYATLHYLAARDGYGERVEFLYDSSGTMDLFRGHIDRADLVVASQPGNGLSHSRLPINAVQARTLGMARRDPSLALVARIPARRGRSIFIFERRPLSPTPDPASGQEARP